MNDIKFKGIFIGRCFDISILNELGIGKELLRIIIHMKWKILFFMRLNVYVNLVYEFYNFSRLKTNGKGNIVDYIMKFRIHKTK